MDEKLSELLKLRGDLERLQRVERLLHAVEGNAVRIDVMVNKGDVGCLEQILLQFSLSALGIAITTDRDIVKSRIVVVRGELLKLLQ